MRVSIDKKWFAKPTQTCKVHSHENDNSQQITPS